MDVDEHAGILNIALTRSNSVTQIGETLWRYAGRDWTFFGHLAILVAISWRLLCQRWEARSANRLAKN